MRFQTLATALASAGLASARIGGIAAPTQLAPNQPFQITILTENYIQSVADIAVSWGYMPVGQSYTVGSWPSSAHLGPADSNISKNITIDAVAPQGLDAFKGQNVVLTAGVYSLYGVSGEATVTGFNVTVKVGDKKSDELVRSQGQGWIVNRS